MTRGVFLGSAFLLLVVLAGLWRLCRRQLQRLRALTARRIAEGELYDALLQDIQGLTLSLQAIADQMPPSEPAKLRLEHALDQADELLARGRERVRSAGHVHDAPD